MKKMAENLSNSYLFGNNADFIEELYDRYLDNRDNVDAKWQKYFDQLQDNSRKDVNHNDIKQKFAVLTQSNLLSSGVGEVSHEQAKVWQLVASYRQLGLNCADLDPLKLNPRPKLAELDPGKYGLSNQLDNEFYLDLDMVNSPKMKLKDIITKLEKCYCGTFGIEYTHISNQVEQEWLKKYVETKLVSYTLDQSEKIQLLQKLIEADGLERFLNTKYPGQKRFSLEGGDSLIAALDRLVKIGATKGVNEIYLGMAHRGRLNTLINIMGKAPEKLINEFDGNYPQYDFVKSNDVKYHKGYKCNYKTQNGKVKLVLAYNPSHLEVINPVINGMTRAIQDKSNQVENVLGVLIHGDSALIGLGTNQGVLTMSQTRAYGVGGMIHIVANNQVGFTTSNINDTRSSRFCTDVVKMIEAPVLHVNGDDVEAVAFAVDLAIEYRVAFKKDIMIDLVCFRRYGHQETDDPTLTQPFMYKAVKAHPGAWKLYSDKLIESGIVSKDTVTNMGEDYRLGLNKGIHIKAKNMEPINWHDGLDTKLLLKAKDTDSVTTKITDKMFKVVTDAVTKMPDKDFTLHSTVAKLLDTRKAMAKGDVAIDFGMAETLAYGSLLQEGINVRISGEDSGRGTFSHRQAVLRDINAPTDSKCYIPLNNLLNKSHFRIFDSVLNEECVMGFEYGYSQNNLNGLNIWEAQFGDFANGAQVMIDQFIVSGEAKWGVLSNLVLLLPHGFDGQGPEHSSARLERFLQLCAEDNMQVVIPSTAAQMFHVLRYRAYSNWVKPLVILMSKRLLRSKDAASQITDFTQNDFKSVLIDELASKATAKKVILCTGQVYYDLVKEREERKLEKSIAIVRVEQLYPFPLKLLKSELAKYKKAYQFVWVQEEPYNQGAWLQIRDNLEAIFDNAKKWQVVARPEASAPACGALAMHNEQLKSLLVEVFS